MSNLDSFKLAHKKFTEALKYIVENESELKQNPQRWAKITHNFKVKFEQPLDATWQNLTEAERVQLAPLYLHRKVQQDEAIKKVIDVFDGKIVKITENKI